VDLIIDASSVINLDNAGALDIVAKLEGHNFCLSPLVIGECHPTCAAKLAQLEQQGKIWFVDPEKVSAELFLQLLEDHELGEGETECLTLATGHPFVFVCDDAKARAVGAALLGAGRVLGSLRLLKWCVSAKIVTAVEAFGFYERMKAMGGFLPRIDQAWFEADE
jgi:predicted nucleic acid-binding protein